MLSGVKHTIYMYFPNGGEQGVIVALAQNASASDQTPLVLEAMQINDYIRQYLGLQGG